MTLPLRVMILDDGPADAELMLDELRQGGFVPDWTRVETEAEFVDALDPKIDVILADYNLPGFSGLRALRLLNERGLDVPFILVSGTIGEEVAVRAMQEGASDYLIKDRLGRLGQAVSMALERRKTRRALTEAEGRYKSLFEGVPIGLYRSTPEGRFLDVNDALVELLGYPDRASLLEVSIREFYEHPEDRDTLLSSAVEAGVVRDAEIRLLRRDGEEIWASLNTRAVKGASGEVLYYEGSVEDITARKRASEALAERERFLSTLNEITRASLESWDVDSMLQTLAERLMELFGADGCFINAWDEERRVPMPGAAAGTVSGAYPGTVLAEPGEPTITGAVLSAGRALPVEDYQNSPLVSRRIAASYPCRSVLGLPLISGHYKLGVATITFDAPHRFTEEEMARGEQAARQISLAIAKARLLDESERRAEELAAAVKVTGAVLRTRDLDERIEVILREMMSFAKTEYGAAFLLDGDGVRLCAARGFAGSLHVELQGLGRDRGEWLRTPRTLSGSAGQPDLPEFARREGIRSWITLPLSQPLAPGPSEAEFAASFVLASRDADVVTDERLAALRRMTPPLRLAVENARAYRRAQERMVRLRSLHEIDRAITSSLDLRTTLTVLLAEACSQLDVDAAAVRLFNAHTRSLEFAAARGLPESELRRAARASRHSHASQAATERRVVHVRHLEKEQADPLLAYLSAEGFADLLAVPLIAKGRVTGVLELMHRKPLDRDPDWKGFQESLAAQAAIALDSAAMFEELQRSRAEVILAYDSTLEGWARALDLRNDETEGRTERISEVTLRLAQELGVREVDLEQIRRGAMLHDIGEIAVPEAVLLKPGPLTEEEWVEVRRHPTVAFEMLSAIPYLRPALDIPYCHHERWDGSGYPRGLSGEQIPLAARIFAVVDVWEALTSSRPYREAWPEAKALAYIREKSGSQFDPRVVEAFLRVMTATPRPPA